MFVFLSLPVFAAARCGDDPFIEAPYRCTLLKKKKSFRKKFGDIMTSGWFVTCKVALTNDDSKDHLVDYACFCLTDGSGAEYDVHPYASMVRQTSREDFSFRDVDIYGFNNQTVKSHFTTTGWLIFEVPAKGEYELKFRGYTK